MKELKVKYVDFWRGFNPNDFYLHQVLKEKYNVVISDNPDILIYSCFGGKHNKYNCLKIYYTGENLIPNFNECDYAIGFCYMDFDNRYHRYPNYLMERKYFNNLKLIDKNNNKKKNKFCIIVNSNKAAKERQIFFNELSKYKQVDSGGKVLNNLGYRIKDKIKATNNYKFTIAFENSKSNGYCTEKIVDAFAATTIPIYYGDPEVFKIFNKDSFIYLDDINNMNKVIELIKKIDNDDKLFNKYLNANKLVNKDYIKEEQESFKKFIYNIIDNRVVFYKNEEKHFKRFIKRIYNSFFK